MSEVLWHDIECHAYSADLPLWVELAASEAGPILDVGAGTGRIAIQLAARGHEVVALDSDAELLRALAERAREHDLSIPTVQADAQDFALPERFGLVLVPQQTIQLLADRPACLRAVARHLAPGGLFAAAIVEDLTPFDAAATLPEPDERHAGGWHYRSQPTALRLLRDHARLERVRLATGPDGRTTHEPNVIELARLDAATLEREAAAAGLTPLPARRIPPTTDHVGSTVVLARA
jgi:SAM-dependent methyltransferase